MIWNKIASRVTRAGFSFALLVSTLVPATALLTPAAVHAGVCSGGGAPLLILKANSATLGAGATSASFEFTPTATWGGDDNIYAKAFMIDSADSACGNISSVSFTVDKTGLLSVSYFDSTRSVAFVSPTDYTNVLSGVTVTPTSNNSLDLTYTIPSIPAATAQLLTVDLSNAGWVDIHQKTGAGVDNLLISLKIATGVGLKVHGDVLVNYSALNSALTQCSEVTGSREVKVRILADSIPVAMSASPTTSGALCPSYDKTSYDTNTKTSTLRYDVANASVDHIASIGTGTFSPGGGYAAITSSLTLTSDGKYFSDNFTASSNASQQLYITASTSLDGKSIPKDTPFPIAGFVADLSAGDVDLTAKAVTFDVIESTAKRAAFAHNLNTVSKDGSFTLYVPFQTGDTFVGVCVGASSLDAVSDKCNGVYYLKDGQTKTSSNTKSIPAGRSVKATVITVGAKKFWQVGGLTGSGAFGSTLASDPATGVSLNTTSTAAAAFAVVLTLGLAIAARKMNASKK